MWIRINEDDHVELEIGSGAGAGTSHRRGLRTINTIPFETWTHVAIVATSATDMTFISMEWNNQSVSTGGTAGTTSILHNGNHAFIGRNINVHQNDQTFGQMDEIRLWDTERTAEEIRSHMCSKLTGGKQDCWVIGSPMNLSLQPRYWTWRVLLMEPSLEVWIASFLQHH